MDKKEILVVDDEPDFLEMIKTRLEANNYVVITASNGQEGLEKVKEHKPALIILDILMPKVDGPAMAQTLKLDPETENIPIIFLTCLYTKSEEKERSHMRNRNILMAKPFDASTLLATIREII
ncbi:MAG: response regulator [Candidatus Omnitrophota bacterium]